MSAYKKVIFVDTNNTCRGIMAEAVFRSIDRKKRLTVCSRGLVVLFPEPINPKVTAILKGDQLEPPKEYSEEIRAGALSAGTLVLAMTGYECRQLRERFPEFPDIFPLAEFAGQPGDIEEPHGGTISDYGACYEYIDFLVKMAAEKLFGEK